VSPSNIIVNTRRLVELKSGGWIVVVIEIIEISPNKAGLFLDRFKLSWIAFNPENPDQRVLVDAHSPFGLHYHINDGAQIPVKGSNLQECLKLFQSLVISHFGELEEPIYEDFYF
jgi:hypothetical protein